MSEELIVPLPSSNLSESISLLEGVAAGQIGAGAKMNIQGQTIPEIRTEYKRLVQQFEIELNKKLKQGLSAKQLARWAVNERTRIAALMRTKQGVSSKIILDLRDNYKYGIGGRTYKKLEARAIKDGIKTNDIPNHLLKKAIKPNEEVSSAVFKGAKFLKNGGRAIVFISISATAYILLTAPEDKLEEIFYAEIGGAAGGFIGGGAGVGLCIAFGLVTTGWGLLGCGVVGGGLGGVAGSEVGNKVFLLKQDYIRSRKLSHDGAYEEYNPSNFLNSLP